MDRERPVACCTRCSEPVVTCLYFRGYEFICVCCGKLLGFLSPVPGAPTPERLARHGELRALWDENVKGKLLVQGREQYASPEKLRAHHEALEWIRARTAGAGV
jgi:hypothetical protein